jgi:5-(carboxyamino)imidazole ribonucleotide mutase
MTNNHHKNPLVSVVMGSQSDYSTMILAQELLEGFGVPFETMVISAHRTPERMFEFARDVAKRGVKIIIAGAGGAAHLPGMLASITHLPVLGVPIATKNLQGVDSLLSIVQMPFGIPVGCLAIGEFGAKNAAILALSILATNNTELESKLIEFRKMQTEKIPLHPR